MKSIQLFCLLLLFSACCAEKEIKEQKSFNKHQKLATEKYAGVYTFGDNLEDGPAGSVTVFPETDSTVLFYLDVSVGAPSYRLGQLYARLKMDNSMGIYITKETYQVKGCKLQFNFTEKALTILTLDSCIECGFGGNVNVDNIYQLKGKKKPVHFINGHGDKVYFEKTKPEDYLK